MSVPAQRGLPEGEIMQQFTYMIVLISIVVTSMGVPLVQRAPFKGWLEGLYGRQTAS